MNDRDERAAEVLADEDADEQGLDNPGSDQVDIGRDDDPTAGGSDIGGRAGEQDEDDDAGAELPQ
jgi:hypothetical protein